LKFVVETVLCQQQKWKISEASTGVTLAIGEYTFIRLGSHLSKNQNIPLETTTNPNHQQFLIQIS